MQNSRVVAIQSDSSSCFEVTPNVPGRVAWMTSSIAAGGASATTAHERIRGVLIRNPTMQ